VIKVLASFVAVPDRKRGFEFVTEDAVEID